MTTVRSTNVIAGMHRNVAQDKPRGRKAATGTQRSALINISNNAKIAALDKKPKSKGNAKAPKVEVVNEIEEIQNDELVQSENIEKLEEQFESKLDLSETEQVSEQENVCQDVNRQIQQVVFNIDKDDLESPQLMAEYVDDIYDYLRKMEEDHPIKEDYMSQQVDITGKMRAILVDWLVQVHNRFHLLQETLFLAVAIIDRYMQADQVPKENLQLTGVTALWIAAKYEEMYSPEVADFVYITDGAYTKSHLRQMECILLRALDFRLGTPLPIHFLRRFSKAGQVPGEMHTMAKYFAELTLTQYDMMHLPPSKLAAASLFLSLLLNYVEDPWTSTMAYYSKYDEEDLDQLVYRIASLVVQTNTSTKILAIRNKYSSAKYFRTSKSDMLTSGLILKLAEKSTQGSDFNTLMLLS